MKISIVTVCKNAVHSIERTILSVIHQTHSEIEYIIIDGCSTDGTLAIVNKYQTSISVIVSEPDKGISDAFNKGIKLCSGEYIGILNADDTYLPTAITNLVNYTTKDKNADAICFSAEIKSINGKKSFGINPSRPELLKREMTIQHPASFIKKSVYEKMGGYRHDLFCAMDYEFFLRMLRQKLSIASDPRVSTILSFGGMATKNFVKSLREVRNIKVEYGFGGPINSIWYIQSIIRTYFGVMRRQRYLQKGF